MMFRRKQPAQVHPQKRILRNLSFSLKTKRDDTWVLFQCYNFFCSLATRLFLFRLLMRGYRRNWIERQLNKSPYACITAEFLPFANCGAALWLPNAVWRGLTFCCIFKYFCWRSRVLSFDQKLFADLCCRLPGWIAAWVLCPRKAFLSKDRNQDFQYYIHVHHKLMRF